jgi:Tfp pilus assembly protein PilF
MADSHTEEGQIARAKRFEDAIERLQSGQPSGEPLSLREKLERAAGEFKARHSRQEQDQPPNSNLVS